MRIWSMFGILLLNYVLQTTIFQSLKVQGIFPNTALIITIAYSLLRGRKEGMALAIFAGSLFDIFFSPTYGLYTVPMVGISYFIGGFQKDFYRENYLLPVFFTVIASLMYEGYFFIIELFARGSFELIYFVINIALPTSIYTGVLTVPIYRLLFSINEYFEVKERYGYRYY